MREMVFRERQEKVAQVQAIARIVAQVLGLDADRVFGGVVADYAGEVFQETYDPELLRRKIATIRAAQATVRERHAHDRRLLGRLERMGDYYDRQFGRPGAKPKTATPDRPPASSPTLSFNPNVR